MRKGIIRRILAVALTFMLALPLLPAAPVLAARAPAVSRVELNMRQKVLAVGKSVRLRATVFPKGAGGRVQWASSRPAVASVGKNGLVRARKAGTAVITCRAGAKQARMTVRVGKGLTSVKGLRLNTASAELSPGDSLSLEATLRPADASQQRVLWASSNTAVARVSAGRVTALDAGSAVITATAVDGGHTARCTLSVTQPEPPDSASEPPPASQPAARSSDATLRSLQYTLAGGEALPVPGFQPALDSYSITLPYGTPPDAVLTLTGVPSHAAGRVLANDGCRLAGGAGQAVVVVAAQDGTRKTYTLHFTTETTRPNSAPRPCDGQAEQTGTATPAAPSGDPAAQPYTALVSPWFEDAEGDALSYHVASAETRQGVDVSDDVQLVGDRLSYLPVPSHAGQSVDICLRASDGLLDSSDCVRVTVTVAAQPPNANRAPVIVASNPLQGEATPASVNGNPAAKPYSCDLNDLFADPDADELSYELLDAQDAHGGDISGDVALSCSALEYTPQVAQQSSVVTLRLRAGDGVAYSEALTLVISVKPQPSDYVPPPLLAPEHASYSGSVAAGDTLSVSLDGWFSHSGLIFHEIYSAQDSAGEDVSGLFTLDDDPITEAPTLWYTPQPEQYGRKVSIRVHAYARGSSFSQQALIEVEVGV